MALGFWFQPLHITLEENFLINKFVRKSAKFEIDSGNKSASVRAVRRFEPYGNVSGRCTYLLVEE